jgi:hypothetical protein
MPLAFEMPLAGNTQRIYSRTLFLYVKKATHVASVQNSEGPGREKRNTRPQAVCPKGKEWSPGGPAEVLSAYQPGTEKCNWEAAAAGGNAVDLVSQRQLQLLAALYKKSRNGSSRKQRRPK